MYIFFICICFIYCHRKKGDNYKFCPVVANSIKVWKTIERRIGGPFKFCNSTPLWHNFNFVCGNHPFVQPSWSSLGVNTCGDIQVHLNELECREKVNFYVISKSYFKK